MLAQKECGGKGQRIQGLPENNVAHRQSPIRFNLLCSTVPASDLHSSFDRATFAAAAIIAHNA